MEQDQHPPAGWYPDPAGGPGRRYWDGGQWTPATMPARRPSRRRRRAWLTVAGFTAACLVASLIAFRSMLSPGRDELSATIDALALPSQFTVVDEQWTGNRVCLESCLSVIRRYSSPSSKEDTFRIFTAALQGAGYHCVSGCDGFDVTGASLVSTWQRTGQPEIWVMVFSTADPGANPYGEPVDPARSVHADLHI
jgi:Protein of unknown function (DUF2510)